MNNIWLIWLAVMWQNLVRNIASKGYSVSVYNRTTSVTNDFVQNYWNLWIQGFNTLDEFVNSLQVPRKILVMVKAWNPVDSVITQLLPLLSKWDTIVDCWNSYWQDTERRYTDLLEKWINFVGTWVSWGEEGALNGPSIMPWINKNDHSQDELFNIFESISAKSFSNYPCVTRVWKWGAWHFVKMVHNGIEYSIMWMIAEVYQILREELNLWNDDIQLIFENWNKWKLNSYLIEITWKVLKQRDEFDSNKYLIDVIKDTAWAKWTWLWTSLDGLNNQSDVSSIIAATFARVNSSKKELRTKLSKLYSTIFVELEEVDTQEKYEKRIKELENALYLWILFSYSQGLSLIKTVSDEKGWNINLAEIVEIWEGGCIIRASLLEDLVFEFQDGIDNLLESKLVKYEVDNNLKDLIVTINNSNILRIATPVLSSSLQYFYSMTQEQSNANMIQILRDHFWAHTYERIDREGIFHTEWDFK